MAKVILKNNHWNRVRVQARKGNQSNCEERFDLGTNSLNKGEIWTIPTINESICYRRESRPDNPDGRWGNWVNIAAYPNSTTIEQEIL
jgi:hypothetical protein